MKSFWQYYSGVIARPRRTFDELMADPHRLRHGFLAVLLTSFIYTLVYLFLRLGGAFPSSFTPWLNIPREVAFFPGSVCLLPRQWLSSGYRNLQVTVQGGITIGRKRR